MPGVRRARLPGRCNHTACRARRPRRHGPLRPRMAVLPRHRSLRPDPTLARLRLHHSAMGQPPATLVAPATIVIAHQCRLRPPSAAHGTMLTLPRALIARSPRLACCKPRLGLLLPAVQQHCMDRERDREAPGGLQECRRWLRASFKACCPSGVIMALRCSLVCGSPLGIRLPFPSFALMLR